MFHSNQFIAVTALVLSLFTTGACVADAGHSEGTPHGDTPSEQAADSSADAGPLATVNGNPVKRFSRDAVVRQLEANGQAVDENQVLHELINLELLAQKAEALGIHQRDDVAAVIRLQYTQTLAQNYMSELSKDIEISDEDIQAEYDIQTAKLSVDEYRASHILLEDVAAAEEVIKALGDGEEFAELAKKRSIGPTGPNGGDLGWFQGESMVPEFSAALETMEVGGVSEVPVKSDFGWHVIMLVDKRGTNKPKYEEVEGELRNIIMRNRLTAMIEQMRDEADIKINQE